MKFLNFAVTSALAVLTMSCAEVKDSSEVNQGLVRSDDNAQNQALNSSLEEWSGKAFNGDGYIQVSEFQELVEIFKNTKPTLEQFENAVYGEVEFPLDTLTYYKKNKTKEGKYLTVDIYTTDLVTSAFNEYTKTLPQIDAAAEIEEMSTEMESRGTRCGRPYDIYLISNDELNIMAKFIKTPECNHDIFGVLDIKVQKDAKPVTLDDESLNALLEAIAEKSRNEGPSDVVDLFDLYFSDAGLFGDKKLTQKVIVNNGISIEIDAEDRVQLEYLGYFGEARSGEYLEISEMSVLHLNALEKNKDNNSFEAREYEVFRGLLEN